MNKSPMQETEFDLFLQMHRICYRKSVHFKGGHKDEEAWKKKKSLEREYIETSITMAKTSHTTTEYWGRRDVNILKEILVENYYVYSLV